jgi:ankyrin repeat protein
MIPRVYQHRRHRLNVDNEMFNASVAGDVPKMEKLCQKDYNVNSRIFYQAFPITGIPYATRSKHHYIGSNHNHGMPTHNDDTKIRSGYTTALIAAAGAGKSRAVRWLIQNKADVHAQLLEFGYNSPSAGETALHEAVSVSSRACVGFLLDADPECVLATDSCAYTPLHYATCLDIVDALITKGADVNYKQGALMTVLGVAVHRNDMLMVQHLIAVQGARICDGDANEILVAAEANNYDMILNLVQLNSTLGKSVDLDIYDNTRRSPMYYAIQYGNVRFLHFLINSHVDVSIHGFYGNTPLHEVLSVDLPPDIRLTLLKMLLDAGANVSASDPFGYTPLHFAIINSPEGYVNTTQMLLEYGAKTTRVDNDGISPIEHAERQRDTNKVHQLQSLTDYHS